MGIHPNPQVDVAAADGDGSVVQDERLPERLDGHRRVQPKPHAAQFRQRMPSVERIDLADVEQEVAVALDPGIHPDIAVAQRHRAQRVRAGRFPDHVAVAGNITHRRARDRRHRPLGVGTGEGHQKHHERSYLHFERADS